MTAPSQARPRVFLLPGGDRRLSKGHPWVFSNEIRIGAEEKAIPPGTMVALHRPDGTPMAAGSFNPHTLIAFRRYTRNAEAAVGRTLIAERLRAALALRARLFDAPFYRLIHAEGDGLPGVVVDRYGDALAVQCSTAGADRLLPDLLAELDSTLSPALVVLRNDVPSRALEGLETEVRIVKGEPAGPVRVPEHGATFLADLAGGQKTGWFFDQRDNRAAVARLARDGRLLDAYCHTGGFGLAAAVAGARAVACVDSSEPALALAREAAALSGVADRVSFEKADVFAFLEAAAEAKRRFDVVCVDPPAFARGRKDVPSALKGYRKLARLAAGVVAPGGFLFAASCSHNVEAVAFLAEVVEGLSKAGRSARVIAQGGAAPDHPVHPFLPETAYLKSVTLALD